MKTNILLIALLLSSLTGYCQTQYQASKYRSFQTILLAGDGHEIGKKENTDILIVVNINKNLIDIYARETMHIDITKYLSSTDSNEDPSIIKMEGVENSGELIYITLVLFLPDGRSPHMGNLKLTYKSDGTSLLYRFKHNS